MPLRSRTAGLKMRDALCPGGRCMRRCEHEVLRLWRDDDGRRWGRFRCLFCEHVWQDALNLRGGRNIVSTRELRARADLRDILRR